MSKRVVPVHYTTSVKELLQTYKNVVDAEQDVETVKLELAKEIHHQVNICKESYRKIARYLTSIKPISHTEVMTRCHEYEALLKKAKGGERT